MADKLKPSHRMTRFELIISNREWGVRYRDLNRQFRGYKFRTDQKIKDLQGAINAMTRIDRKTLRLLYDGDGPHLPTTYHGKTVAAAGNFE
jgi:lysyl-tRNA synthetase class II